MKLAPSLLSADFANLQQVVEMLNASQADWLHCDIMDGEFVPNITFGPPVVKTIKKHAKKPLDVHLMIARPERYFDAFRDAGADILTIHYEAVIHLHRAIQQIKNLGMQAGVVINPHTPVNLLEDILLELDLVLIMSVNPGFGGQKFIENSYKKIQELKQMIVSKKLSTLIEVDGGVDLQNAPLLIHAGADVLVAGNAVFSTENPVEMIAKFKAIPINQFH